MSADSLIVRGDLQRHHFHFSVDFSLPMNGVTAIFGRSGCGKTTLLRLVAGLEKMPNAVVKFGDQVWQDKRVFMPLHQRRIGLVFQEHSLFPHLSVLGNLLYGYKRTPEQYRRLKLEPIAEMLGIVDLLDRRIDALSGGQRQRVAIGRALLTSPQLLLLDEPLSALDEITKREIMPFLDHLSGQVGVPILMVSHSSKEVERLADRVIFMADGKVERIESIQQALSRADSPLFNESGAVSVLTGYVKHDDRGYYFYHHNIALMIPACLPEGKQRLRIMASDVAIALDTIPNISVINQLWVKIIQLEVYGSGKFLLKLCCEDGQILLSEVTHQAVSHLQLSEGMRVVALIKAVALVD